MPLRLSMTCCFLLLIGLGTASAIDAAERVAWTTTRVEGTPEPALPFRSQRILPGLSFTHPTLLAFVPGSQTLLVGEQEGKLWSCDYRGSAKERAEVKDKHVVIDLSKAIQPPEGQLFEALYGLTFDPRFQENRQIYLCYTLKSKDGKTQPQEGTRVSRFQLPAAAPLVIQPETEQLLLTFPSGGHNGGCLEFGHDGYLYITTGDAAPPNPPDGLHTGQDCSDLLSSILRIDVHPKEAGKPYSVPADNPFVGQANVRPEIWAFGFRNPWKMTFDRANGELWVADVGWDQWEMVHWVTKGGNYGWSVMEGRQPILPNLPLGPSPVIPPLVELPHTISASVTGGYVYRGKRFPELVGEYVFGDWETKMLWGARRDARGKAILRDLAETDLQIVAFGEDAEGELLIADYGQGTLHELVRHEQAGQPSKFPKKLSETGLFAEFPAERPAAGVIEFEVNQPQWSDYATARRLIGLPGTAPIIWHPGDVAIPNSMFQRQQEFPTGTVLAKTLSLEMKHGDPTSARKIETQLLHFDGKNWRGYSYRWNDTQTDAELIPATGQEIMLQIEDTRFPGGLRQQAWTFSSRTQCLSCHTPWAQHALAFNPLQLHRLVDHGGQQVQQLKRLEEQGIYQRVDAARKNLAPLDAAGLDALPRLVQRPGRMMAAEAESKPLTAGTVADLARSYLHANCSHCHRFNGGGAGSFELLYKLKDSEMNLIGAPARQGTFDQPDALLVTPHAPDKSLVYLRISKFGQGRMPHLASELVDEQAVAWFGDWITHLQPVEKPADAKPADPNTPADSTKPLPRPVSGITSKQISIPPELWPAEIKSLTTALDLARRIGRGQIPGPQRDLILKVAAGHPSPLVRDLFEGYQPAELRRKILGSIIRPETVLAVKGRPERGEQLFWKTESLQCRQCHRVGAEGGQVGPELTEMAHKRTPDELLDSLLEPSRLIEKRYAMTIVETISGQVLSGLLIEQSPQQIRLRDAQGKDHVLPRAEIEQLQTSVKSLMPDGLLRNMTAEEAADLLAYLVSLKSRPVPVRANP